MVGVLDVLIVAALLLGLMHGVIRGVGRTLGGIVGLLAGGGLALWVLPNVEIDSADRVVRLLVFGGVLTLLMLAGQAVGELITARVVGGPPRRSALAGLVDRAGGGLIGVTAAAVVVMALVGLLGGGPVPWVAGLAAESRAAQTLQRITPPAVSSALSGAQERLAGSSAMRELDTLLVEPAPAPLGDVEDPDVLEAAGSVVEVVGLAPECGTQQNGSGFVAPDGRVVTNAHVVSGTRRVTVLDPAGRRHRAEVVAFVPETDLAVLSVEGLQRAPLELAPTPPTGSSVAFAGYPLSGPLQVGPARLQGTALTSMSSIDPSDGDEPVEVLQFAGEVNQGNSGGPLLDEDGRVIGVVFAKAAEGDAGFAVTGESLEEVLADSAGSAGPVDTADCQPLEES